MPDIFILLLGSFLGIISGYAFVHTEKSVFGQSSYPNLKLFAGVILGMIMVSIINLFVSNLPTNL